MGIELLLLDLFHLPTRFSVGNAYIAILIVFNTAGGVADQTRKDSSHPMCTNELSVSRGVAVAYTVLIWFYELMQV